MNTERSVISVFTTRVRQMILQYSEVKKENNELYSMVDERDKKIADLKKRLDAMTEKYNALKTARMLEVTDGDIEETRKRMTKLLKDVNACISLLR